jgi:hypothetical protein
LKTGEAEIRQLLSVDVGKRRGLNERRWEPARRKWGRWSLGMLETGDVWSWGRWQTGRLETGDAGKWGRKQGTFEMGMRFAQCRKRRILGTGEAGIWETMETGTLAVGEAG